MMLLINAVLGGIDPKERTSTEPAVDAVAPNEILAGMLILSNPVPAHIIGPDFAILEFARLQLGIFFGQIAVLAIFLEMRP